MRATSASAAGKSNARQARREEADVHGGIGPQTPSSRLSLAENGLRPLSLAQFQQQFRGFTQSPDPLPGHQFGTRGQQGPLSQFLFFREMIVRHSGTKIDERFSPPVRFGIVSATAAASSGSLSANALARPLLNILW